jgi:hypothetical protein
VSRSGFPDSQFYQAKYARSTKTRDRDVSLFTHVAFDKGFLVKSDCRSFERLANPGFPLNQDELRAIHYLNENRNLSDAERSTILIDALNQKHIRHISIGLNRGFELVWGTPALAAALQPLVLQLGLHFLRNSRISKADIVSTYELGQSLPTRVTERIKNSFEEVSLDEFCRAFLRDERFCRFHVVGRLPFDDWCHLWRRLWTANIVRTHVRGSVWESIAWVFVRCSDRPLEVENPRNLAKRMSRRDIYGPSPPCYDFHDPASTALELGWEFSAPRARELVRVHDLVKQKAEVFGS